MYNLACTVCLEKTPVDHPDAGERIAWICPSCDEAKLTEICPGAFDMDALRVVRGAALKLFNRASAGHHARGDGLTRLLNAMIDLSEDEDELLEPGLQQEFGMSLTVFTERLVNAVVQARLQDDKRSRLGWYAHCIVPPRDWWIAQGEKATRWRADSADGKHSPYLEFISYELGRMANKDARDLAGAASVKRLTGMI